MAVTTAQYERVLSRLTKIERTLNDILTAVDRFVTSSDTNALFVVLQTSIEDIEVTVAALSDRVDIIETEPYDETS